MTDRLAIALAATLGYLVAAHLALALFLASLAATGPMPRPSTWILLDNWPLLTALGLLPFAALRLLLTRAPTATAFASAGTALALVATVVLNFHPRSLALLPIGALAGLAARTTERATLPLIKGLSR